MLSPHYHQPTFYGGNASTFNPYSYGHAVTPIAATQHFFPTGYNFPQQAYHALPQEQTFHHAPAQLVRVY
jgi:hypothetical protein